MTTQLPSIVRSSVLIAAVLAGGAGCRREVGPAPPPPAPPPAPDATPSGEGPLAERDRAEVEALVNTACVGCHTFDMLEQQRLTRTQWENTVKKMKGWGAPVDPAQMLKAARYLADRFSPKAAAWEPAAVDPAKALADLEPVPDGAFARGDAAAGKEIYARSCALCHGADGRGTPLGVNVVDRPLLTRAPDFAALVKAGRGRMPALPLPDKDIAALLAHLRTAQVE